MTYSPENTNLRLTKSLKKNLGSWENKKMISDKIIEKATKVIGWIIIVLLIITFVYFM
jgi:hypothetical protein